MGYVFDFKTAQAYDSWYSDADNRFVAELEDQVLLGLLEPLRRERLLDIGCGTGRHLQKFLDMGLDVTGLDASPHMLGIAKERLGHRAELHLGTAEDLPFEDNTFHVATLITTLEFVDDPQKALQEACRVTKDRLFLGVLNRYAIKSIERRLKGIFSETIYNRARFFSVLELKSQVRQALGEAPLKWRTVHHLPASLKRYTAFLEKSPLVQYLPFGTFIGMAVSLVPWMQARGIPVDYVSKAREAGPSLMQTPTHSREGGS